MYSRIGKAHQVADAVCTFVVSRAALFTVVRKWQTVIRPDVSIKWFFVIRLMPTNMPKELEEERGWTEMVDPVEPSFLLTLVLWIH